MNRLEFLVYSQAESRRAGRLAILQITPLATQLVGRQVGRQVFQLVIHPIHRAVNHHVVLPDCRLDSLLVVHHLSRLFNHLIFRLICPLVFPPIFQPIGHRRNLLMCLHANRPPSHLGGQLASHLVCPLDGLLLALQVVHPMSPLIHPLISRLVCPRASLLVSRQESHLTILPDSLLTVQAAYRLECRLNFQQSGLLESQHQYRHINRPGNLPLRRL